MSKVRLRVYDRPQGVLFGSPLPNALLQKIIETFNIGVSCLFVEWLFYFKG